MRYLLLPLIAFLLAVPASAISTVGGLVETELDQAGTCEVSGLKPTLDFIKKYDANPDPDVRSVVGEARFNEAFVYWFRQHYGYRSRFKQIIKLYDDDPDPRLAATAARARLTMAMTERNRHKKIALISPIINRYSNSSDTHLADAYYKALRSLSDIRSKEGAAAEADRLAVEASKVYLARVRPYAKPSDPSTDKICL